MFLTFCSKKNPTIIEKIVTNKMDMYVIITKNIHNNSGKWLLAIKNTKKNKSQKRYIYGNNKCVQISCLRLLYLVNKFCIGLLYIGLTRKQYVYLRLNLKLLNQHWQIPYQVRNDCSGVILSVSEISLTSLAWDSSPVGSEWRIEIKDLRKLKLKF